MEGEGEKGERVPHEEGGEGLEEGRERREERRGNGGRVRPGRNS